MRRKRHRASQSATKLHVAQVCRALFVALFAILMLTIPSALAQETFGLSAEDFALFSSPNVDADSLGFDFAVDLNITGAPDESVTMALTSDSSESLKDPLSDPPVDVAF